jgi:hypothetical protein
VDLASSQLLLLRSARAQCEAANCIRGGCPAQAAGECKSRGGLLLEAESRLRGGSKGCLGAGACLLLAEGCAAGRRAPGWRCMHGAEWCGCTSRRAVRPCSCQKASMRDHKIRQANNASKFSCLLVLNQACLWKMDAHQKQAFAPQIRRCQSFQRQGQRLTAADYQTPGSSFAAAQMSGQLRLQMLVCPSLWLSIRMCLGPCCQMLAC